MGDKEQPGLPRAVPAAHSVMMGDLVEEAEADHSGQARSQGLLVMRSARRDHKQARQGNWGDPHSLWGRQSQRHEQDRTQ